MLYWLISYNKCAIKILLYSINKNTAIKQWWNKLSPLSQPVITVHRVHFVLHFFWLCSVVQPLNLSYTIINILTEKTVRITKMVLFYTAWNLGNRYLFQADPTHINHIRGYFPHPAQVICPSLQVYTLGWLQACYYRPWETTKASTKGLSQVYAFL